MNVSYPAYERPFAVTFQLVAATSAAMYIIPLAPSSSSTTLWASHFHAATRVELVSAELEVVVPLQPTTEAAPLVGIAFVSKDCGARSADQLGIGGAFAAGGANCRCVYDSAPGLRRILKSNAPDDGDLPAVAIAVNAPKASVTTRGAIRLSFVARFSGVSDYAAYNAALPVPQAKSSAPTASTFP
jgi:hypothetical protein